MRAVLLLVIVLHLVADTALSPFYPQLFRELYGITDLTATGTYVWVCRAVAVVALPLWGLAARRWPLERLVVAGLLAAAALDAVLGFAPSYLAFTVISAGLVLVTMSMALAYPALVARGKSGDRLREVRLFATVLHAGTIASTLIGAGVLALPDIRYGISAFAVLDLALAYYCHRILVRPAASARAAEDGAGGPDGSEGVRPPHAGAARGVRPIVVVAAIVLVAEVGRLVVRPFFTAYVESGGGSMFAAGLLFLLPSVAVLAVLPLAGRARRALGPALLPVACLIAAAGLAVQAAGPYVGSLVAGRLLFGAGLGLGQVALDLRMFEATGTGGPAFSAVATTRTAATLISPILATATVAVALPAPLAVGAALFAALAFVLALLLALETRPRESYRRRPLPDGWDTHPDLADGCAIHRERTTDGWDTHPDLADGCPTHREGGTAAQRREGVRAHGYLR